MVFMRPKKPSQSKTHSFTEEDIRVKAHKIWKKRVHNLQNSDKRTAEDDWKDAIEELQISWWGKFWRWTGIPEKKGWDLITGISIPFLIFGGGTLFTYWNNQQQQIIADDKQKNEVLKNYFDDINALLINKDHPLRKSKENDDTRIISRTLTLTALMQLTSRQDQQRAKDNIYNQYQSVMQLTRLQNQEIDKDNIYNKRKSLLIKFLWESNLIKKNKIVDLTGADLNGVDLNGANLSGADLSGANLINANLVNANLNGADLSGAYLYGTDLSGAYLNDANLSGAYLNGADLSGADLNRADLKGANFFGAYLANADFKGANLKGSYLYIADLNGADLKGADLNGANLKGAYLIHADLSHADLKGANLYGAYVSHADFKGANLYGANLYGANLYGFKNITHAQIKEACFWYKAIYTEAFQESDYIDKMWGSNKIWVAKDKKANQKIINQIEEDKSSTPKEFPTCK